MRRTTILLLTLLACLQMTAQRINQQYNNVSLSDALQQLNSLQSDYTVNFIYNDLEDFRVTTSIKNRQLKDAIKQLIGFYPVRVIEDRKAKEFFVECTHKTDRHLSGRIIDEEGLPVAFANVALLSPRDSMLIGSGVSGESGVFVIPIEQLPVLVRISFIGYKTRYKLCSTEDAGRISMQTETYTLNDVTVKGAKHLCHSTERGLMVNVEGTPLSQFGSVSEMLSHMPLMLSDGSVAGHGKPEIYVNNKKVRDAQELDRLRAEDILSAEIITNPGPEYGAEVTSVIRLKTIRKAGEGLSGNFSAAYRQGKEHYDNANAALNYRLQNGMDFFARGYFTSNSTLNTGTSEDQLQASSIWDFKKENEWLNRAKYYFADLGWNWEVNDRHSLGLTYTAFNYVGDATSRITSSEEVWRDETFIETNENQTLTRTHPHITHSVNAYYVGKVGSWQIDLSADFYDGTSHSDMEGGVAGEPSVSSETTDESQLLAEKLVLTAPVKKGSLTFGEEVSVVDRVSRFEQSGFANNNMASQQTTIWSLFANYALQVGHFSLNGGLRWQNEYNRWSSESRDRACSDYAESRQRKTKVNCYDLNGQRQETMSPKYSALIPRLSVSYQGEEWRHTLSYSASRQNPPYSLLTTHVNYRNKYEYDTGNPFLNPTSLQSVSLSTSRKWFYAELYYSYITNSIRSFQEAYDDDKFPGVLIMDYRNIPKAHSYGIELSFTPKIGIWQMNYTAQLGFNNLKEQSIGITHHWNGLIANFNLDNTLSLPRSWLLNIRADLSPYNETGCAQKQSTGGIDLRLSKQLLKDKSLSITLLANDILKTRYTEMTAYGGINIRTHFREYRDARRVGINLSWHFNATRSRYKGSHAGQSERNRL